MKLPTNYRWRIVGLLFAATCINYIDRNVLSFTMIDPAFKKDMLGLSQDATLTEAANNAFKIHIGYVDSAFKLAYAFGFLLMGYVIDKLGTKKGFATGILLWTAAAFSQTWTRTLTQLSIARTFLGIGEAANFPAAIKTIAEWFPKKERGLATGLFNAGANVGIIATAFLVPLITLHYGWRSSFFVSGFLGLLLFILWRIYYKRPDEQIKLSAEERAHIESDGELLATDGKKISWIKLLRYRQTWAYAVGKFMADPIWWFYLTWLPDFFNSNDALDSKLNLKSIGIPFIIIYVVSDIGSVFFGWLSSYFLKRGFSLNKARKLTLLICALCVVPISFASQTHSIYVAIALISLATAAHTGWAANIYTFTADMFPKSTVASVTGIGSMFGALGGVLLAAFAGVIRVKYGYYPLFLIASLSYVTALLIIHIILPKMHHINAAASNAAAVTLPTPAAEIERV